MSDEPRSEFEWPGSLSQHLREIASGQRSFPQTTARRHHYVPQFWIRNFTIDDSQLTNRYSKSEHGFSEVSSRGTGWESRMYRGRMEDGGAYDGIESFFSVIEQHASETLVDVLSRGTTANDGERVNLAFLIALQRYRTPAGRRELLSFSNQVATALLEKELQDSRSSESYFKANENGTTRQESEALRRTALEELRSGALSLSAPDEHWLVSLVDMVESQVQAIEAMNWHFLHAVGSREFVLGDSGLTLHDPSIRGTHQPIGWRSSPYSFAIVPFSPDVCLRLDYIGQRVDQRDWLTGIDPTNRRTWGWAESWVVARSRAELETLLELESSSPESIPARPAVHESFVAQITRSGYP